MKIEIYNIRISFIHIAHEWKGLLWFRSTSHWFQEDIFGSNFIISHFPSKDYVCVLYFIQICMYVVFFVLLCICHPLQHDPSLKNIWFSPKDLWEICIFPYHVFFYAFIPCVLIFHKMSTVTVKINEKMN